MSLEQQRELETNPLLALRPPSPEVLQEISAAALEFSGMDGFGHRDCVVCAEQFRSKDAVMLSVSPGSFVFRNMATRLQPPPEAALHPDIVQAYDVSDQIP